MAEPYYGNRQYRQYGNLGSGVNMMEGSSIPGGFESMTKSLAQIEQQKQLEEADRQQKFQELVKYDLKDVRGNWQDQAVAKKQDFINSATDIYRKSQGRPTWEQQKGLLSKKDDLERFAGMSRAVEDWYGNALKTNSAIKDIPARNATAKNIGDIRNMKTLEEQYKAIQSNEWLVNPDYNIHKDFLDPLKIGRTEAGLVDKEHVKNQISGLIAAEDPAAIHFRDNWLANNPEKEESDWISHVTDQRVFEEDQTLKKTGTSSGSGKDKANKHMVANKLGQYKLQAKNDGKGIPIGSFQSKNDKLTYSGATIDEVYYDADKKTKMVKISFNVPNLTETEYRKKIEDRIREGAVQAGVKMSEKEIDKAMEDELSDSYIYGIIREKSIGKDMARRGSEAVPYEEWEQMIAGEGYTFEPWTPYTKEASTGGADKSKEEIVNDLMN